MFQCVSKTTYIAQGFQKMAFLENFTQVLLENPLGVVYSFEYLEIVEWLFRETSMNSCFSLSSVNPIYLLLANVSILYPLKHQKTKGFFRGYEVGTIARNGPRLPSYHIMCAPCHGYYLY